MIRQALLLSLVLEISFKQAKASLKVISDEEFCKRCHKDTKKTFESYLFPQYPTQVFVDYGVDQVIRLSGNRENIFAIRGDKDFASECVISRRLSKKALITRHGRMIATPAHSLTFRRLLRVGFMCASSL